MQIQSPKAIPAARILSNSAASRITLGRRASRMALALVAGALLMAGTLPSRAEPVPSSQIELARWIERDRPSHRRDEVRRLPQVCALEIDTRRDERGRSFRDHDRADRGRRGKTVVYTEGCLLAYGVKMRQLPYRCVTDMRVGGRRDRVFPENCLLDYGFELPRRRG